MPIKQRLVIKGNQTYDTLIQKFKARQEKTSLEEALVYLKLRQFQCSNKKALIFAKKKEIGIDGTVVRDGPPGYRKLLPVKPEGALTNGWLRGQKLRYQGATGYSQNIINNESKQKREITKYNQKIRNSQEVMRKQRGKSLSVINLAAPKQTLEKISSIRDEVMKERENRSMYIEFQGVKLDQTTKNFFKEAENINVDGFVVRLGAFDHMLADENLQICIDQENIKGKGLTTGEMQGQTKRTDVIMYKKSLESFEDSEQSTELPSSKYHSTLPSNLWRNKSLSNVPTVRNTHLHDPKTITFYQNVEKMAKMEFLSKRRFRSNPTIATTEKK